VARFAWTIAIACVFSVVVIGKAADQAGSDVTPSTQPSGSLDAIDNHFKERAAEARRQFDDRVSEARQQFDREISTARAQRNADLTALQASAMKNNDLDLAIAARDKMKDTEGIGDAAPQYTTARIEVKARIDGIDILTIRQDGARWDHKTFGLPTSVSINGMKWDLQQSMKVANSGNTPFLPFKVDFETARIVAHTGRGSVTLKAGREGVDVAFDDEPPGSDDYSVLIDVQITQPKP